MAAELQDGSIMLNMRDNRNYGNKEVNGRRICVTTDLGETWTEHPTSRKDLIESTCMASLHRHIYKENGKEKSILLFCNPESYNSRDRMTLKVSFDDGNTWVDKKKSCSTNIVDSATLALHPSMPPRLASFMKAARHKWSSNR